MNDYWNDPPEYPDPPQCPECHGDSESEDGRTFTCSECGHKWTAEPAPEYDPETEPAACYAPRLCAECAADLPEAWDYSLCVACGEKPCRHGNPRHDCGPCDHAADLAYTASKER